MKKTWLRFQFLGGIAPALRGGTMSAGGIAPALRGGTMSAGGIAPALRGAISAFATLLVSSTAMAQGASANEQDVGMFAALGAGLAIGIAAAGCGVGQGRAGAAALDGIARNPNASDKLFTPMILVLALIESLAIYALVIAIMLLGKVPG